MQEMEEMWVRSLGQEDLLEKGMKTHSSILAQRIAKSWTQLKRHSTHTQEAFSRMMVGGGKIC